MRVRMAEERKESSRRSMRRTKRVDYAAFDAGSMGYGEGAAAVGVPRAVVCGVCGGPIRWLACCFRLKRLRVCGA